MLHVAAGMPERHYEIRSEITQQPAARQGAADQCHAENDGHFSRIQRPTWPPAVQRPVDDQHEQKCEHHHAQRKIVSDEKGIVQRVIVIGNQCAKNDGADQSK